MFGADLKKAYNTIRTGLLERNLRRFVWKFSKNDEWKTFWINKVHFGEINTANELECAKIKIAKFGENIEREAARKLIKDSYVDDIYTGCSHLDINRIIGTLFVESGQFTRTLPRFSNIVVSDYITIM